MSYISHVDYKSMMENFKKGAPKQMLKESLDPVGKEDDDINNDGKVDKTDKYLSSRRQAIGKSIGKGRMMRESDPQNDMWYEDFEDGLQNLAKNKYISPLELQYYMKALDHVDPMDKYSDFDGHDAAKEFVDDLRSKEDMQESGTGDESFDFNKSAIESATGDKISHTEMDDYDRVIYWSTKNPNVTYYINDNDQIIKYNGETGERHAVGDLGHYDEPEHDYEPDTDADYEEPRDDFDMAGDFNDGEFWENEVKKLKEIAGLKKEDLEFADDDAEDPQAAKEKRRKKMEMDDEEAENAERDELDEEGESKSNFRDPLVAAKNVASKYKAELQPKFDEYQKSYEEYIQAIRQYDNTDPEFREIAKAHNALVKAFQSNVLGLARQEMEDAGEKAVVAKNLAYGYSDEDWPSEFVTALNKELKGVVENAEIDEEANPSKSYHGSTANQGDTGWTIDFTVIENTPEYFKIDYVMTPNSGNAPRGASRNYRPEKKYGEWKISKVGDKGQPLTDYEKTQLNIKGDRFGVNGKEFVSDIYGSTGVDNLNEEANYEDPYTLAKAVAEAHPELQRFALEDRKMFQRAAFKYASELMKAGGVSNTAQINLINGYADEDWPSDYISALGQELEGMEEGLHMPPLQATGPTVSTNEGMHMPPLQATGNSAIEEDQAPFGMSVLSPDERKQLKEYINSYRTIKTEISKLLSKTGKSGKIMENAKKVEDETVPAERKAKYRDPATVPVEKHKHSNLGGDRTNLVMTKAEMWENEEHEEGDHERIESMLDTKLHDAFHKVTGMVIKDLMDGGFDEGDIKNFLQHEIEEKAKEYVAGQYDL